MKRIRKTVKRNCLFCEKEFDASLAEVKRGNARFCSIRCGSARNFMKSNEKRTTDKTSTKICLKCGLHFKVINSEKNKRKFCSLKCRREMIFTGEKKSVETAFALIKNECFHCSKTDDLVLHHIDHNHYNNDPNNWRIVCRRCHVKVEHLDLMERNFKIGLESRKRNKRGGGGGDIESTS